MDLDLTVGTGDLASAASALVRLVPGKLIDPVLSGVLLTAGRDGVSLAATDRERAARVERAAVVHTEGRVLVPAKPLADTLRALDLEQVRLVVEGSKLAIRAPGARFALPLLDADVHPGVAEPPARVGTVDGAVFGSALATVATAASRDEALPMFTGVRVRSEGARLVLVATDRYQMAVASLGWRPAGEPVDALVPASLLAEIAKQAAGAGDVVLHADRDRFGLSWSGTHAATSVLDGSFLHESKVSVSDVDTTLELEADALAGAVRRVGLYTDARGVLLLEVGDGEVRLRGADQRAGEAEESVKATVTGDRTSQAYQSRFLTDALRPFLGGPVRVEIQPGMRATVFRAPEPADLDLRYVVMPMLPPKN
ncbi:DNA polymerase III subunit beta [Actinophytocola gossypii]|uniref:DNA polymerase III subunit beta n=1 Tax=Actinophytocola gossypii TaxID=2812003 RepID=A0ABT2J3N3_9PSEU|nr:DNA polymerase III subunit beta [Actinophytocola gossypii]MCT2582472.1 DNA polymerase III subunit beta [Actinophytocola gossypii]